MTKLIAIPLNQNGILDSHFGHCKIFSLMHIENNKIIKEERLVPPPHKPGLLPKWLSNKGVTDILAGGIGQKAIDRLNFFEVNVFVGADLRTAKELTESFLAKELELKANYCNKESVEKECKHHD